MILPLAIGFFGGLRALTPPALLAWAAALGWLQIPGTLSFMGSTITAGILTVLAIAEMVADKLPTTPSRTAPPGLIARIALGGLTGACLASAAGGSVALGAVLGALGGVAGCFAGYSARTRLVRALGVPDLAVAVLEDLVTVAGSLLVVTRL